MITLIGHTDNSGTTEESLALGIRRVMEIRETLIDLGVPFQKIDFLSRGATEPLEGNTSDKENPKNNRVEILPSQL